MAGEVTPASIASICIFNMTDSCCMADIVESTSCENGAFVDGFCNECASCFAASMALSYDDGKGMVKLCGKN